MKTQTQTNYGEKVMTEIPDAGMQQLSNSAPAKTGVTAIAAIATADATDLATALVLVNACKAKINALIAALKVVS